MKPTDGVEAPHENADSRMKLAEYPHQLLRLDRVDEARPPAEVGEEHRELAAMAEQDRLVARRDDRLGELWREEPLEPPKPLDLPDLAPHAPRACG